MQQEPILGGPTKVAPYGGCCTRFMLQMKTPATSIAGVLAHRELRRAYSVPLRQSSKPSITSAWVRSTSGRCFSAASYSPAYSASETSVAQS